MRTIKFRGKASHNGEWLYGDLINIHGEYHILGEDDMREDGHHVTQDSDRPTWVEPDTIGQFTGLHDKNGKEIYEGDIVEVTSLRYGYEDFMKRMLCGIVYDNDFCCFNFLASDRERWMCRTIPDAEIEVIGNVFDNLDLTGLDWSCVKKRYKDTIHDNPKLLENEKD